MAFAQIDDIKEFQKTINKEFSDQSTSPLQGKELKKFKSPPFYDIDLKYRGDAILRKTDDTEFKPMKTTTARFTSDRVYGLLIFTLEGKIIRSPCTNRRTCSLIQSIKITYSFHSPTSRTTNGLMVVVDTLI